MNWEQFPIADIQPASRFSEEKINETNQEIKYIQTHEPAGKVLNYDTENKRILFSVRNRIKIGDCLEILLPENIVAIKNHFHN